MTVKLSPKLATMVRKRVKAGQYESPEAVVSSAMRALVNAEKSGDFAPGELDKLIEEGERSIREEGTIPGEQVFEEIRQLARKRRKRSA
jgi:putative addiction module CopG family antidote